jgi:hypothetical protein
LLYSSCERTEDLQVIAVMSDNATNNDKMMEYIESYLKFQGIDFDSDQARMRCLPHIINLAANKVRSLYSYMISIVLIF